MRSADAASMSIKQEQASHHHAATTGRRERQRQSVHHGDRQATGKGREWQENSFFSCLLSVDTTKFCQQRHHHVHRLHRIAKNKAHQQMRARVVCLPNSVSHVVGTVAVTVRLFCDVE